MNSESRKLPFVMILREGGVSKWDQQMRLIQPLKMPVERSLDWWPRRKSKILFLLGLPLPPLYQATFFPPLQDPSSSRDSSRGQVPKL
jgi:hypothetical protein